MNTVLLYVFRLSALCNLFFRHIRNSESIDKAQLVKAESDYKESLSGGPSTTVSYTEGPVIPMGTVSYFISPLVALQGN